MRRISAGPDDVDRIHKFAETGGEANCFDRWQLKLAFISFRDQIAGEFLVSDPPPVFPSQKGSRACAAQVLYAR